MKKSWKEKWKSTSTSQWPKYYNFEIYKWSKSLNFLLGQQNQTLDKHGIGFDEIVK